MAAGRGRAGALTPQPARRDDHLVVVAAAVCVAVGGFDLSGVNLALPLMARSFSVPPAAVQWVTIGYLLPIAALALPAGRWLDTVGRREALLVLIAGFVAASTAAGAAPSFGLLVAFRVLQGVFGAGLFAIAPVVAFEAVRPERRGRAVATVSAVGAVGGVAGPSLGAFVTQALGWPWIFWSALPVLLAVLPVVARRLPRGPRPGPPSPDLLGEAALLGLASAAVLLALTFTGGGSPAWALLTLAAIPPVILWSRRYSGSPALGLLRRVGFRPAVASLGALAGTVLSVQYLFAFLAERSLRLSPVQAGAALLVIPAATVLFSVVAAALSERIRIEFVATSGFLLLALGTLSGSVVGSVPGLFAASFLIGAAQGIANPPATHLAMSFGSARDAGSAGATISFFRNIGFTAGPAVVSAIWALGSYSPAAMRFSFLVAAAFALAGGLAVLRAGVRQRTSCRSPSG